MSRHPWKVSQDGTVAHRGTGEVLGHVIKVVPLGPNRKTWASCRLTGAKLGDSQLHPTRTAACRALWRRRYSRLKP